MSEQMLKENFDIAVNAIQNGKSKAVIDAISTVRNATTQDMNSFYDFVGNVFRQDPDFFNKKVLKSYNKNVKRLLNPDQIFDLESQILQKHCFYRDEQLLGMSNGIAVLGSGKEIGRIYVTNIRIICIGVNKGQGGLVSTGLINKAINKSMHKSIMKGLQRRLGEAVGEVLPCIGSQYPMFGVMKKKMTGKRLYYKVKIPSGNGTKKYMVNFKALGANPSEFLGILNDAIDAADAFYSKS